mgnify:FL=1
MVEILNQRGAEARPPEVLVRHWLRTWSVKGTRMLQYSALDPFEYHRLGLGKYDPPKTTRRQVRLEIYLPLAIAVLIVVGVGALLGSSGVGDASVWADSALALLLGMAFILGLLLLTVLTAAGVGVWYVIRVLPDPLLRARMGLAKARDATIQVSDRAVRPVVISSAGLQAARATLRQVAGIFQR